MRIGLRPLRVLVLGAALVGGVTAPARADGFLTPFVGYNFGGDSANCISLTACEEKRLNFGVSIGSMGTLFGFEEDIAYAKDFFGSAPGTDNSVFTAMSNLIVGIGAGPVQPYVLGGIGLIRPHVSINPTQIGIDKTAFGYDLGGGVNAFFARHVGVRGDVRHLHTVQDVNLLIFTGQKLDFWRGSLGLTLRF